MKDLENLIQKFIDLEEMKIKLAIEQKEKYMDLLKKVQT